MVKGEFNSTEMSIVITTLETASKEFDASINSIKALDVPSFSYSGWITGLPSILTSYQQQCSLDLDWCSSVIESFNNFNDESIKDIGSVEVQSDFSKEYEVNKL